MKIAQVMPIVILFFFAVLILSQLAVRDGWREGFVKTLLLVAATSYLFTELESFFSALNSSTAILSWAILLTGTLFTLRRYGLSKPQIPHFQEVIKVYPFQSYAFVCLLICLLIETLLAPPNNYDSMSYHMARVVHWVQNQNVAYYPTSIARQLYHNPMAEYLIVQLQLLSNGDWWANSVQFGAMLGALSLVSLLVKKIGLDSKEQFLAVILVFAIPAGLFQSTSTQNDYVAAFFLLSTIYFGWQLSAPVSAAPRLSAIIWLALSLSLGAFTKYTTLVFALPFCLWFGVNYLRNYGLWGTTKIVTVIVFFLVVVLTPFIFRNLETFGNPVGPKPGSSVNLPMANAPISLANTYSNVLRNLGNQVGLPVASYNQSIDKIVEFLHQIFGLQVNKRANSYLNDLYRTSFSFDEDLVNNLLYLLLSGWAFTWLVSHLKRADFAKQTALLITVCLLAGFVLFSALLRWQSTSGRLLLPLLIVACVPICYVVVRALNAKSQVFLMSFLLITCVPVVLFNKSKPLVVLDNWIRQWTNQPQQVIPEIKFNELIQRIPHHADFLKNTYEQPYLTRYFQLKKDVSTEHKKRLVTLLDSLSFMKKKPFWASSRHENYFRNRRNLHEIFERVTTQAKEANCKNIGLDLGFDGMEYPLWVLLQDKIADVQLHYIRYAPVMAHTPNVPKHFGYDCLLTEFEDSVKDYPPSQIKAYYDLGEIKLIIFKQPQYQIFVRERYFFDKSFL